MSDVDAYPGKVLVIPTMIFYCSPFITRALSLLEPCFNCSPVFTLTLSLLGPCPYKSLVFIKTQGLKICYTSAGNWRLKKMCKIRYRKCDCQLCKSRKQEKTHFFHSKGTSNFSSAAWLPFFANHQFCNSCFSVLLLQSMDINMQAQDGYSP